MLSYRVCYLSWVFFVIRWLIMFGLVSVEVFFKLLVLLVVILCKIWCIILFEWVFGSVLV